MSALQDALTRVLARHWGRALPIRATSALAADPAGVIGIATIKIVTEEQIQALAFGPLDAEPAVIARLDPIGRDVADLLPFARFLADAAQRALAFEGAMRIWVPHAETIAALDVLGHRYWRNQTAPPEIVRMGEICRILAHEALFAGQQVIADSAQLLRDHTITGQSSAEDGHLDAMLAWFDRQVADPLEEARRRSCFPASGVLINTPDRRDDDRVDRLRKEAKSLLGERQQAAHDGIRRILSAGARREWRLMIAAREAFWGLGLPAIGLEELVTLSKRRLVSALTLGHFPPRRADKVAIELDELDAAQHATQDCILEADDTARARARRAGAAIEGRVVALNQPRPGRRPCTIELETAQTVVRTRRDDKVKIVGTNVSGVVRDIAVAASGGTQVRVEIMNGVRSTGVLFPGSRVEIIEQPGGYVRVREFSQAAARGVWMFFGTAAPVLAAVQRRGRSPLAVARGSRRP
jgi:hypothetical protein